jgi:hypothetical protein
VAAGIEVHDHDDGCSAVGREGLEKGLQGLDAAGRGADADDDEAGIMPLRSFRGCLLRSTIVGNRRHHARPLLARNIAD